MKFGSSILLWLLLVSAPAQTLVLTNGVKAFASLANATVTMSNRCELRLTAATGALTGCVIDLNSLDSFLVFQNVKPSIAAGYLAQVRVNGAAASLNGNCRIVQYGGAGSILLPHASSLQPLEIFSGPQFSGGTRRLSQYIYYRGTALGGFDGQLASFKLKRGYMATLAQNADGTGASRNYVAQDGDLEVSLLPSDLEQKVRFAFVAPWRWASKKGIAGDIESPLNVQWKYNWNISQNSTRDLEYVPIRQNRYWPDLASQNWQTHGATQLLGYNEPDRPDQANLSVADALSSWGDLLATGLRVGAPAVSDGGRDSWLYPFIRSADTARTRVDFVPVHYYWCFDPANPAGAANQMYSFLKVTYDTVKRPLWITEWNNGANWTGCAAPTFAQQQACVAAMVDMLEATPFVERYALYNWVEDVRRLEWDDSTLTQAGVSYRDKVSGLAYLQSFPNNGTRGISYLRFDGDALDSSGFGNNGIAAGSPAYVSGKKGQAMAFDGANTVVTLPQNIARTTAFTFAAWVYWNGGGNWQRIFDFGNSTTEYLFLTPSSGNGTLRFAITKGSGEQIVETSALAPNQWRHVAITVSGNTARLYVNGAQVAVNAAMSISPADFSPRVNFLGKSQFVADPLFNGLIDDVVISDTAFPASQIAAMQVGGPPDFSAPLSAPDATQGKAYSASIAGTAADPGGGAVSYIKAAGPAWLTVLSTGAIFGTPTGDDVGTNYFTVRVTDVAGVCGSAVLPVIVRSSLPGGPTMLARYSLDATVRDASSNLFNATAFGAPGYVTGKIGSAIDLDGANGYLKVPASLWAGVSNFTFAAWVYWDGGAAWQRIFDFGNDTSQYLYLSPSSGSGTLRFSIKNGGAEQLIETTALASNQWRHVAVTLNGGVGRVYVNGVQVAANSAMTISPASFNPRYNYLGKSQFSDPLFNGRVDEVFVFNYALSATEVAGLMTNQMPPPTSGATLTANWIGGELTLTWPSNFRGYRLETASELIGAWTTIPGSTTTTQVTVGNATESSAFYRLAYP